MLFQSDYQATFDAIDADHDGMITATELKALMTTLGQSMTDETAAAMIGMIDADADGKVTRSELADYLAKG